MVTGEHSRVEDADTVDDIRDALEDTSEARVVSISEKTWKDNPPAPLNLPWAQRKFRGSPSQVLSNIQSLYSNGNVTYPRTEAQNYGNDFDFNSKLDAISNHSPLDVPDSVTVSSPTEGDGRDDAHPPITPTVDVPYFKDLGKWEKKAYIRVVKHFLATLMEPARKRKVTYTLQVDDYDFEIEQYMMEEMGYFEVYNPYKRVYDDTELDIEESDIVDIDEWEIEAKETNPPSLWSQSGVVDEMKNEGLGTSATRANMVEKVINRGYVHSDSGLRTGRLGQNIINTLREYAPRLTDPDFTRQLEEDLERIEVGEVDRHETLDQTTEWVSAVCEEIADNEYEIGRSIRHEEDACPECGADMWLNKSEHGLYWSCSTSWDDCDYTESA